MSETYATIVVRTQSSTAEIMMHARSAVVFQCIARSEKLSDYNGKNCPFAKSK